MLWPKQPVIYEINAWTWLRELSRWYGKPISLGSVPEREWDALAARNIDAVWLMGVWERSPAGIDISLRNPALLSEFRKVLPDFKDEDDVGSPYCIRRYGVDANLGGPAGLASARDALRDRGLRLILDFVPNHVALDHPWLVEHPEYFIQGSADDAQRRPADYFENGGKYFARGKDPYFPAWTDVLQLNAFEPGLRRAAIETVSEIAGQCDGVRCDMAMLMLNLVFSQTWGARAGRTPVSEYWSTLIPAIKSRRPEFKFIAEAYWDREWDLQQLGFDHCYDKRLYDRLVGENAESVRLHLLADRSYQDRLIRFLENHDEPRAAAVFSPEKGRAAAVATFTLPGAKLFHEGQGKGRKVRLPVFLGRRPEEPADLDLEAFYRHLLAEIRDSVFHDGEWRLCERYGWPDNPSYLNVLAWCWNRGEEKRLVIVNYSDRASQARVRVPWDDLRGSTWQLDDTLSERRYERDGDELQGEGLFVDLSPWQYHVFRARALSPTGLGAKPMRMHSL